jgi:hypothetical protein
VKQHKTWSDKDGPKLLPQIKLSIQKWLKDPSQMNGDDLNNLTRKTGTHFRKKGMPKRYN